MPRGIRGRTIAQSFGHLGLSEHQYGEVRENIGRYLRKSIDIHMASDSAIRRIAGHYMNTSSAQRFFSDEVGLKYRWSIERERLEIERTVEEVMAAQQSYAIDTLHRRSGPCPGCRYDRDSQESRSSVLDFAGSPVQETSERTLACPRVVDSTGRDSQSMGGRKRQKLYRSSLGGYALLVYGFD